MWGFVAFGIKNVIKNENEIYLSNKSVVFSASINNAL
jgi:hypothetical protein